MDAVRGQAVLFGIDAMVDVFVVGALLERRSEGRRSGGKVVGHSSAIDLDAFPDLGSARGREAIALDDALNALEKIDPRKVRVIELRYFAGLTAEETAEVLKISPNTVLRDWRLAKSWLLREMSGTEGPSESTG